MQPHEDHVRAGHRRIELYGSPGTPEGRRRGARRRNELYGNLGTHEDKVRAGRIGAQKMATTKPRVPEIIIWAFLKYDLGVLPHEMEFQPRLNFNAGVPDFRVGKLLGEYDGGGHHAFRDRSKQDREFDSIREAHGFIVIRETDPYLLAIKLACAMDEV